MSETAIMKDIRAALNATKRVLVTRNQVGFDQARNVRYGLGVGSPDLAGVLIPSGVAFCVEVKTPAGKLSADQKAWWRAWRRRGVRGGVATSVEAAMALLDEATQAPR